MNLIECKGYKIFIISDTHDFHRKLEIPKCDIIIHWGIFAMMKILKK